MAAEVSRTDNTVEDKDQEEKKKKRRQDPDEPEPQPRVGLIGLITALTALIVAITAFVTALTPLGKLIAGYFGHKEAVVYPAPAPQPLPASLTINPTALHFEAGVPLCMKSAYEVFNRNHATNISNGDYWVQADAGGTQVIILCGWEPAGTNAMVITAGTNPDKLKAAAVDYRQEIFHQ